MKIIRLKITVILCLTLKLVTGQITLDYIDNSNTYWLGTTFYPVDIDNNMTKYLFIDTANNRFNLYNMNFTPFMTNIQLPGSYNLNYKVMYVSRQLFDCDSTTIEYVYSAPHEYSSPFKIFQTNGNLVFSLDSAVGIYLIGILGGSNDIRPIRKTSAGYKMFLGKYVPSNPHNVLQYRVYSLCGELPMGYIESINPLTSSAKVYPNPTNSEITFEVTLPTNISKYNLVIYDTNGKEMIKENNLKSNRHTIDISTFSSGVYFYSLMDNNKPFATGKILSTK